MPKRPKQHVTGDLAESSVAHIFRRCGWACETIHHQYGDDLIVQPKLGLEIDHNKIYVQVKGTEEIERHYRDGHYVISLPRDVILKWVRSSDLVVAILWDTRSDRGYYCIPEELVSEWDLCRNPAKSIGLSLEHPFTEESALRLGWVARIRNYNRMLSESFVARHLQGEAGGGIDEETVGIAVDLLDALGVMERRDGGYSLSNSFVDACGSAVERLLIQRAEQDVQSPEDASLTQSIVLALLDWSSRVTGGCMLPSGVLYTCTRVIGAFERQGKTPVRPL